MSTLLGPAAERDAVNEMLASVGEEPVDTIVELPPAGNTALELLRATSRDLQEAGFTFNRELEIPLAPNTAGEIAVPHNTLRVDPSDTQQDFIQRGKRLYDRSARSYVFDGPVNCDLVIQLSWDELPAVARRYFTAVALERFVEGFPGADATSASRQRNLLRAEAAFRRAEIKNADPNLVQGSFVQNILRRS